MSATVAVLGAGSWGTALALRVARNGFPVRLWEHDPEQVARLARDRCNRRYLPDATFPENIQVFSALGEALRSAQEVLIAVPSHAFSAVLSQLPKPLPEELGIAWATKGLEPSTGRLLHEVALEKLGQRPMAVISGPSFAKEVAREAPTAVTVASPDPRLAQRVAAYLHSERFRVYTRADWIGVQIGGAAKNVLAIATGIADGLGFGANTRAALITRGLAELTRLGTALGGQQETFTGLAGLGDLVLTCTDDQSRNRRLGLALARGIPLGAAKEEIGQEIEGVITAKSLQATAQRLGVEMPISEQVYQVLYEGLSPAAATRNLLMRASKAEQA